MTIVVREATAADVDTVLTVERAAFGSDAEAELVRALLNDDTAHPLLSLLAIDDGAPVGHILFTNAWLEPVADVRCAILAPLAVIPSRQKQGVGGALIAESLERLRVAGVELVFVLGHTAYYPRHGFEPALSRGLEATYAIPDEVADAWMVLELSPGALAGTNGRVVCAEAMNKPEMWRE